MNKPIFRGRGLLRPALRPALLRRTIFGAAVIAGVTLVAGCGGPPPQHHRVDGAGNTSYVRALAISQCQAAVKACAGLPRSSVGNAPF